MAKKAHVKPIRYCNECGKATLSNHNVDSDGIPLFYKCNEKEHFVLRTQRACATFEQKKRKRMIN